MKLRNKMKQISKKNKQAWLRIVEVMILVVLVGKPKAEAVRTTAAEDV